MAQVLPGDLRLPFGFCRGGLELAVDGYIGILVEIGVGFQAFFGLLTAFHHPEIVAQKTDLPLHGLLVVRVFQGVCTALRLFDEFAVRHTGG